MSCEHKNTRRVLHMSERRGDPTCKRVFCNDCNKLVMEERAPFKEWFIKKEWEKGAWNYIKRS